MISYRDGLEMAVDMLMEMEATNGYGSNFNIEEITPDNAGEDWEPGVNEAQNNIVFRYIQALSSDPANTEALKGFCAVLTDRVAIGADAEVYERIRIK